MNAQRWEEIQTGFDELVELSANDRAGRLAKLASTDPELSQALKSMLESDSEASVRLASIDAAFLPQSDRPQDPLGLAGRTISHFEVREALGAGGMGVVYRADDTRLGRAVALKFLLPHYSLDASAKARFLREAHATATLDHPNLCTVYEVGTSDEGWLFLAMALYHGETLRARLTRDGPIPVSEALEIARQIADGLQAAHDAGIVHRDLKPGNVMLLADGKVRILDFGLAKARDQSISETGARFGTVSYMSPEQIRGENVDGRADLWALGVVLYEMLTGRKPFAGDEEVAIAHAILHDEPELLSTRRPDISAALEGLVLHLLQKDPAKRYANATELLNALARVRTRVDGFAGLMWTGWRRVKRSVGARRGPARRRLELGIGGLTALALGYVVIQASRPSTTSSAQVAADASPSIAHIAPSEIASAAKHATESPEAHEFYRQGRYYFEKRDSVSLSLAQRYFERAVRKDTMYALAYDGLSDAYSHQSVWGNTFPRVSFPKAKVYAARALALDSTLAEVHSSLAFIALFYDWNLPVARAEFQKAISLNPNYPPAHLFYAWYLTASDSMSAAIREGRLAVELGPSSSLNYLRVVSFLFYDRQYEEALKQAQRIYKNDPTYPGLSSELARAYAYVGRCDEALKVQHFEPSAIFGGVKGYILARCGRRSDAVAELARLRSEAASGKYVPHYALAVILSGLGKKDEAIGELDKAFVVRDFAMFLLKRDPAFDSLHSDPRFAALVRKVGLAPL